MKRRIISGLLIFTVMVNILIIHMNNVHGSETSNIIMRVTDDKNFYTNKTDQEMKGPESFIINGDGGTALLDSNNSSIKIFNGSSQVKEIKLPIQDDRIIDFYSYDNLYYLLGENGFVYITDENGKVKEKYSLGTSAESFWGFYLYNSKLCLKVRGENSFLDFGNKSIKKDMNGYSILPSGNSTGIKYSQQNSSVQDNIVFSGTNGGTEIVGQDSAGKVYIETKDVKIGEEITIDRKIYIYDKGIRKGILYVPDDDRSTTPFRDLYVSPDGKCYYLNNIKGNLTIVLLTSSRDDVDTSSNSSGTLSAGLDKFLSTNLSNDLYSSGSQYISRKDVQKNARDMIDLKWNYLKSLNGRAPSYVTLPAQLVGKDSSSEEGIPYSWGGNDGIVYRSDGQPWGNFLDAISKCAIAGNVQTEGGYKSGTAGVDCSGFIQNAFRMNSSKIGTYTIYDNYTYKINYSDLKPMDILNWTASHVVIFEGWVYNNGSIIGARTYEATTGNSDGTGNKAKHYYRSLQELKEHYAATRYKYIQDGDFIANNAAPTIISPVDNSTVNIKDVQFSWEFQSDVPGDQQTGCEVEIYKGALTGDSSRVGSLVYKNIANSGNSTLTVPQGTFDSEGVYTAFISTKNIYGEWSSQSKITFTLDTSRNIQITKAGELVEWNKVNIGMNYNLASSEMVQYKIYDEVKKTWSVIKPFGKDTNFDWLPLHQGNYDLAIWFKNINSGNNYDYYFSTTLVVEANQNDNNILSPAYSIANEGDIINFHLQSDYNNMLLTQYQIYDYINDSWSKLTDFGSDFDLKWTAKPGKYQLVCFIKTPYSANDYDTTKRSEIAVTKPGGIKPVFVEEISPNMANITPGGSVTFNTTAIGGTSLQYKYYAYNYGADVWTKLSDYNSNSKFTWNPNKGKYQVVCFVKDINSTADYDGFARSEITANGALAVSVQGITPNSSSIPIGASIDFNTIASGGTDLLYKYAAYNYGTDSWIKLSDYNTNSKFTWRPDKGKYQVVCFVKDVDSKAGYDGLARSEIEVKGAVPVSVQGIIPVSTVITKGTAIEFNTTASGGTNLLYEYAAYNYGTDSWIKLSGYNSNSKFTWLPGKGKYQVVCFVKDINSKASFDGLVRSEIEVKDGIPVAVSGISPSNSAIYKGQSITFNTAASGGSNLLYQYSVYNYGTDSWTKLSDYNTNSKFTWWPGKGKYQVVCFVKDVNSKAGYDGLVRSEIKVN